MRGIRGKTCVGPLFGEGIVKDLFVRIRATDPEGVVRTHPNAVEPFTCGAFAVVVADERERRRACDDEVNCWEEEVSKNSVDVIDER